MTDTPRSTEDREGLNSRAIARAKQGDPDALHFLYVRHADDVYRYVNSILRDPHEAEDVTQNVFARLLTAILKYEQREAPFAAWLLRVARNSALDHIRSRRMIPCEEVRTSDDGQAEVGLERFECLREALRGLPDDQREVLVLRHIAGLSPGEIAERLGKTESSVHGLHHRGREALRTTLRQLQAAPVTSAA